MTVIPTSPENPTLPKEIREIALALAVQGFDPSLVNEQFLKFSGVIGNDWELAQQPVVGPGGSRLVFKNGVSVVAQPHSITFLEGVNDKPLDQVLVGRVASAFVEKLPNAQYTGVAIAPKCLIPLPEQADGARKFITETLLSPGPWLDFGKAPVQANLELNYLLEGCQLNLKINQATLQMPDRPPVSALLFSGNFNYALGNPTPEERLQVAKQYLGAWQSDFDTFGSIVNEQFLAQQQPASLFG